MVMGAGTSGSGLGNGKAAALLYAREGAIVFAVDVNTDAVAETQAIIASEGGDCLKKHGRIDVLHNNVGLLDRDGPVEVTEETWDRIMNVNVKGMFLTCKKVLPVMERQGRGVIVNISSVAAIRYLSTPAIAYSTSKAAIVQFTKSIAVQYARKGIRSNCVLPGIIDTPLIAPDPTVHTREELSEIRLDRNNMIPLGHMGEAWDVAQASLFLASDEAKYITGAELVVDGGLTCTCIPNW